MRYPDQPDAAGTGGDDSCPVIHLERARKLGRRLRIEVSIDTTGWLRTDVEIVVHREADSTIRPVKVRVGADANDDAILERGGVIGACEQYNAALDRLRQLAQQLDTLVRQGQVHAAPGSPLAYAKHELARLDELIANRQQLTIGHGVIRLAILVRETEFFARCDAHLAPIVLAAERSMDHKAPRDPLAAAVDRLIKNRSTQGRA